ncbi:hypothetical protein [Pseudomonas viridiflava]|uniref:hypothetical protein n=1 Tax=Pseudomonas syringae group TaxID=136849 RepID=UPI000F066EDB|nr:hypothetical protein [Pseudomonas viridiflava]
MDFISDIAQVWGIPSWFIPATLLLVLRKSQWTKGDISNLLTRSHVYWQLSKKIYPPTAEWKCSKCGRPSLAHDGKLGVKAEPLNWGLSVALDLAFELLGSTRKCSLPLIVPYRKMKSVFVNCEVKKNQCIQENKTYIGSGHSP